MRTVVVGAWMLVLGLCVGCSKESDSTEMDQQRESAKEKTAEAMQAVSEYAEASKEALKRELGELADKLEAKLEAWRDKSGDEAEQARAKLNEQQEKVAKALANLGDASAEQWENIKQGTRDVVADVQAWLTRQVD